MYYDMIRKIQLVIIFFLLGACHFSMMPSTLELEIPDGPPEFRAGWHNGCHSALSMGSFNNARFHDLTVGSGIYQHDEVYQTAWSNGWFSCIVSAGSFSFMPGMNTAPFQ